MSRRALACGLCCLVALLLLVLTWGAARADQSTPATPGPSGSAPPLEPSRGLSVTTRASTITVRFVEYLPCDASYTLKTKREGRKITVAAVDTNKSTTRTSCASERTLETVVDKVAPG